MEKVKVFKFTNANGISVEYLNYGATIYKINVPDKNGNLINVVVSLNKPEDYFSEAYIEKGLYLGTMVGRYAGRISNGGFEIDEKRYNLYNVDGVHLHGGPKGLDKKYWEVEEICEDQNKITFSCFSEHLEEGYPGDLTVKITYQLTDENELHISYSAKCNKTTHLNLTNHSYFNLNGKGSILEHDLHINSDRRLEVDSLTVPSGKFLDNKNSRFDYLKTTKLGKPGFEIIDDAFEINKNKEVAATLYSKETGILMEVKTNQPAVVVFTHPEFPELPLPKHVKYKAYPSICFECQNFPDAPNKKHFHSSLLKPGEDYKNTATYKFTTIT